MRALMLSAALLVAAPAFSDNLPSILEVTSTIAGAEVRDTGQIVRGPQDLHFRPSDRSVGYRVQLALGRAALAELNDCLPPRDTFGALPACEVDISAEIVLEGGHIILLVFALHGTAPVATN